MTRPYLTAIVALVGTLALSSNLTAQRRGLVDVTPPNDRRGFWIEGGIGWGGEAYKFANEPWAPTLGKPTFNLQLGGTVNSSLRLGVEWASWWNNYQNQDGYNVTEGLNHVNAVARIYPVSSLGLYGKAGVGLGISSASVEYGTGTSETGFGYSVGAGYEIKVSQTIFITPAANWFWSSYQQREEATLHERLYNFSLSVTFQPGR
jgi:opacity protein-like surface antigen